MAVRDVENAESHYQGFSRVLVPTDFSDASQKAIDFGIRFANFLKADFELIHVVDLMAVQDMQETYPASFNVAAEPSKINVDPVLEALTKDKQFVGELTWATRVGHPPVEIVRYAEEKKADFIVMGTHGRKGWERVLMGSVLAGVLARSKIPVISIH